jgi:hypothetical protein
MKEDAQALVAKVYDDALSPTARAVGESLAKVVKASLRPVDGLVWTMNRSFDWVAARVTSHFEAQKALPENITAAPVEILSRVLFGLQLAGPYPDPLPRNMFAHLLALSMTKDASRKAHPAFAEMLRELVPDEARLIAVIYSRPVSAIEVRVEAIYTRDADIPNIIISSTPCEIRHHWEPLQSWASLSAPEHVDFYLLHLERLGLVNIHHEHDAGPVHWDARGVDEKCFYPFKFDEEAKFRHKCEDELKSLHDKRPEETSVYKDILVRAATITHWGSEFASACGASEFFSREKMTFRIPDED